MNETIVFFFTSVLRGGGEKALLDIAEELHNEGYLVRALGLYTASQYQKPFAVPTVYLGSRRMVQGIIDLARYLRREKPKVLVATQEHAHVIALLARTLARSNTRIVLRVGIPYSLLFRQYKIFRDRTIMPIATRVLYPKADRIIAVSYDVADDLSKTVGISCDRIDVIYNFKDIKRIQKSVEIPKHPWLMEKEEPVILAAGRLEPQKDFGTLIRAFSLVRSTMPVRLIILGSGSMKEELMRLAEGLAISNAIDFPGHISPPYGYMKYADVFVLSSRWEGFPNVLVEALALRTPVIATNCISGPREILAPNESSMPRGITQAEYGIVTPVGDEEHMAEAITLLLTDKELREHYKNNGASRALDFDMRKILPRYKKILGI